MPLNNIVANQWEFSSPKLLVSLAYRIEVHCFYLITLIWLPNNLRVRHKLEYKLESSNNIRGYSKTILKRTCLWVIQSKALVYNMYRPFTVSVTLTIFCQRYGTINSDLASINPQACVKYSQLATNKYSKYVLCKKIVLKKSYLRFSAVQSTDGEALPHPKL
jgi:hypothetical protein